MLRATESTDLLLLHASQTFETLDRVGGVKGRVREAHARAGLPAGDMVAALRKLGEHLAFWAALPVAILEYQ